MSESNANHDDLYNLIFRPNDLENLPDLENYVRGLYKKGYFKKLIDENNLLVEEVKKLPISNMCEIFFRKETQRLKNGDIIIFKDTGDYQLYLPQMSG